MLQSGDGVRCPHVIFTTQPEGIITAHVQVVTVDGGIAVSITVPAHGFVSDLWQADAFNGRCRTGKIFVNQRSIEANGIKDLRAAIGLVGGNAHFRHHLEQPLANGLDIALLDFVLIQFFR